jgi:diguanylate cyclase (GGDEF)-like protein
VASWSGGHESPTRLLVAFVVVWAACFCRARTIVAYVLGASATFFFPYLEGHGLPLAPFLREQVLVLVGFSAIALTVALLRRAFDRSQARAAAAAQEQEALLRVATAVADGRPPAELHELVSREAATLVGADGAGVLRVVDGHAEILGSWSADGTSVAVGTRLALGDVPTLASVAERGRPVLVTGERAADSSHQIGAGYGDFAMAPIRLDDRVWGVVAVSAHTHRSLAPGTAEQLAHFGPHVATAALNAEHRERLAAQAFSDPLTGLANHRSFHERLGGEVDRALRHDRALSLVLIDVDAFKTVNDGAGHEVGDRVLSDVADRLRATARSGDLLARIGGDEFAWLLPETSAEEALTVVERARRAVAGTPVLGERCVTISAGVCDLHRARDADALFRLADGALYWSKAHGRDTARVYDPETVRELSATERAEQLARHQALLGIRALARAIDAKDPTTHEHSGRVAELACALATQRGWSEDRVRLMEEAALVHDVGKIGIADAILLKPGRLTDAEYDEVKRHAELGAQIVEDVLLPEQVTWIRGHHERPDGRGYPDGLTAGQLTEGAALMALADAFDVMTAARPYSTPKAVDVALAECRDLVGRQFTAEAVAALEALQAAGAPTLTA